LIFKASLHVRQKLADAISNMNLNAALSTTTKPQRAEVLHLVSIR